ncbi:MAG TPA: helix-turn-helix transcriptional regulator [Stellaceae bacterium]|jgi:transcriptional regulator with XRE-family HTH domain|nr:helix-turn-helix transcriptional regulator [Stellaceae bacterium]
MKAQQLVAHNMRKLRVKRGVSQENLAVDAGIDRTYISRLERGIENPTVAVLERLAAALESDIGAFFVMPGVGETFPAPLRGGRKARS